MSNILPPFSEATYTGYTRVREYASKKSRWMRRWEAGRDFFFFLLFFLFLFFPFLSETFRRVAISRRPRYRGRLFCQQNNHSRCDSQRHRAPRSAEAILADKRQVKMNGGGKAAVGRRKEREEGREKEHISEAKLNLPRSVPRDSNQFEGSRISEREAPPSDGACLDRMPFNVSSLSSSSCDN